MNQIRTLDFSGLPVIEGMDIIIRLDLDVHAVLSEVSALSEVSHTHQGETKEFPWDSVVLDAPTLEQLQRCSEAKTHYAHEELARAADWLDDVQHTFGVGEVFRRELSAYCREVILAAGPVGKPNKAMQATCEDARA